MPYRKERMIRDKHIKRCLITVLGVAAYCSLDINIWAVVSGNVDEQQGEDSYINVLTGSTSQYSLCDDIEAEFQSAPWGAPIRKDNFAICRLDSTFDAEEMKKSTLPYIKDLGNKLSTTSSISIELESEGSILLSLGHYVESQFPNQFSSHILALDLYLRAFLKGEDKAIDAIYNLSSQTAHAFNILGILYGEPIRIDCKPNKSSAFFIEAFEKGISHALNNLVKLQQIHGQGVDPNLIDMIKLQKGDPWSQYLLENYDRAARLKNALSLHELGEEFLDKLKSRARGIDYLTQASEQGHADATQILISCYQHGLGVEKSIEKVVHYQNLYEKQREIYDDRILSELLIINEFPSQKASKYPLSPWIQSALSKKETRLFDKQHTELRVFDHLQKHLSSYKKDFQAVLSKKTLSHEDLKTINAFLNKNEEAGTLDLARKEIDDEYLKIIFPGLAANNTIEVLNLSNNKLTNEGVKSLAKALKENNTITEIDLSGNDLADDGLACFLKELSSQSSLNYLHLGHNPKLTKESVQAILGIRKLKPLFGANFSPNSNIDSVALLEVDTRLTSLSLIEIELKDHNMIRDLAETLKRNNKLLELKLSHHALIRDTEVQLIAEALKKNRTLRSLYLGGGPFTPQSLESLGETLQENSTIAFLTVSDGTRTTSQGLKAVASGLKLNKSLTGLNLKEMNIDNETLELFADALIVNKVLLKVDLSLQWRTRSGLIKLSEALKVNNTLTYLSLNKEEHSFNHHHTHHGHRDGRRFNRDRHFKRGARACIGVLFAEVLKQNNSLVSLHLKECRVTPEGVNHMGEALEKNTTLKHLTIGRSGPRRRWHSNQECSYAALFNSLKKNSSLDSLYLLGSNIKIEDINILLQVLNTNTTLNTIDLDFENLKSQTIEREFKEALEELKNNNPRLVLNHFGQEGWRYKLAEAESISKKEWEKLNKQESRPYPFSLEEIR